MGWIEAINGSNDTWRQRPFLFEEHQQPTKLTKPGKWTDQPTSQHPLRNDCIQFVPVQFLFTFVYGLISKVITTNPQLFVVVYFDVIALFFSIRLLLLLLMHKFLLSILVATFCQMQQI